MDIQQTNQALTLIFQEEKKRLVFWYDVEKEFEELLPSIEVEGVTLIRIDKTSALDLKIKLETRNVKEKFILLHHTMKRHRKQTGSVTSNSTHIFSMQTKHPS